MQGCVDHSQPGQPVAEAVRTPVLVVPGFGHNEQGWMLVRRHLSRAGFLHVSVAETPGHADIPRLADQLARHVDVVTALAGTEHVHVVGHNVGGIVLRYYVQILGGDAHVATAITVGTPHAGTGATRIGLGPAAAQVRPGSQVMRRLESSSRPLPVRWVSYFSDRDIFVDPAGSAIIRHPLLRATNVLVPDQPHLSLVLPPAVGRSIATQLAAAEHVPGYGMPVTALHTELSLDPDGHVVFGRPDGIDPVMAAKARHPSASRSRPRHDQVGLHLA